MDEYEELANKRTKALIESFKQTLDECKAKFREQHPELSDELIEIIHRAAVRNLRFK